MPKFIFFLANKFTANSFAQLNFIKLIGVFSISLNIFNKKFPQNLTELITVYENIKEELIQIESDHLIDEYTKVIRSLKDYGSQTNNTQESTQQVHLSFE